MRHVPDKVLELSEKVQSLECEQRERERMKERDSQTAPVARLIIKDISSLRGLGQLINKGEWPQSRSGSMFKARSGLTRTAPHSDCASLGLCLRLSPSDLMCDPGSAAATVKRALQPQRGCGQGQSRA